MKAQPKQEEAQQQTELERLEDEITATLDRQQELSREETLSRSALKQREATLGSELLQGVAYQDSIQFIQGEKVRIIGILEAERQLSDKLSQLVAERDAINGTLAVKAYEAQVAEAEGKLIAAFTTLQELSATINGIVLAPPRGYATDQTEKVRNLWNHLRGMDFHIKLGDLAPRFPDYFQKVKK